MLSRVKRGLKDPLQPIQRRVHRFLERDFYHIDLKVPYTVIGTEYGGWPIIDGSLNASSIVYSFGVGADISFDLGAIKRYGCSVFAFDPTPKSTQWIAQQKLPSEFQFHPVGIGAEDGEAEFYPPAEEAHVSFSSAPNKDQRGTPVVAKVMTLSSIMKWLGHDKIDVLKMDIEGFEYPVIKDLLEGQTRPGQVLAEFHHRMYKTTSDDTRTCLAALRQAGYRVFYVSSTGREYGLALRP